METIWYCLGQFCVEYKKIINMKNVIVHCSPYERSKKTRLKNNMHNWVMPCYIFCCTVMRVHVFLVSNLCCFTLLFLNEYIWCCFDKLKVQVGWLVDWLIGWSVDRLIGWLVDWLICWLVDWLIGWSVDWLIGWLVFSANFSSISVLSWREQILSINLDYYQILRKWDVGIYADLKN